MMQQIQQGTAGFEKFYQIMQIEPKIHSDEKSRKLENPKGRIKFDNVNFAYNNGELVVLKNFNLDIKPGEKIGLIGETGVGKSTISKLIPRFYDVHTGSISIDGVNIKDYDVYSLRRAIGHVQQDVFIFYGTLRDNILYGNPEATDEEIMSAAKRANIHEFISGLPDKYMTYVGEKGVKLSGGQKQRIAIARLFLKKPKIVILDEATSALDNVTERLIQSAFDDLIKEKTAIVIAHRLSTIMNSDRIIVLGKDGIIEMGNHDELVAQKGIYFNLLNEWWGGIIMELYEWVLLSLGVVLLLCCLLGAYIAIKVIKPNRRSLLESSIMEEEFYPGLQRFYKNNLKNTYTIKSRYGYNLQAYYFESSPENKIYMVMAHGHTYTHHGCVKYAQMMMRLGYNVILFDERYHGNSGGNFTTLGHYEKWDLYDVISDTFNRYGEDIFMGTYGESMGAATVLLEGAKDNRIKFIVSDCGFSSFEQVLRDVMTKRFHIPVFPFFHFAKLFFWIFTKARMKGISPIKALDSINVPIMFVHGEGDNYIPYSHSIKMHEYYQGEKKIFIAGNNADHASSYQSDTENYEKNINEFLNSYIYKK